MEIFPSRYVGVFSLQDNNNNGFATTHPTCNFSVQSRKLINEVRRKALLKGSC